MAKRFDPFTSPKDGLGNRPDESWASNLPKFRDPVSGKVQPQNPEGKPAPASKQEDSGLV